MTYFLVLVVVTIIYRNTVLVFHLQMKKGYVLISQKIEVDIYVIFFISLLIKLYIYSLNYIQFLSLSLTAMSFNNR